MADPRSVAMSFANCLQTIKGDKRSKHDVLSQLTTQQNTRTSESDATPITYTTCEGSGVDSQGKDEENDLPLNLGEVGKAADLEEHFLGDRYGMGCYGPVIKPEHTEIHVPDYG